MTRVLLVEDDDFDRVMFKHRVRQAGVAWHVTEARDLETAVGLLEESTFDLVITDLILPDGEGQEIISALRKAGARRIALLSGLDDAARAGLEGAVASIDKNHFGADDLKALARTS